MKIFSGGSNFAPQVDGARPYIGAQSSFDPSQYITQSIPKTSASDSEPTASNLVHKHPRLLQLDGGKGQQAQSSDDDSEDEFEETEPKAKTPRVVPTDPTVSVPFLLKFSSVPFLKGRQNPLSNSRSVKVTQKNVVDF